MAAISKELIKQLVADVPDVDDCSEINYWKRVNDKWLYLEGWIDQCLVGTGFASMEQGEWDAKIDYIKGLTTKILAEKALEYGLHLEDGGFVENENEFILYLYGVTWGLYRETPQTRRPGEIMPAVSEVPVTPEVTEGITLYHGTRHGFEEFSESKLGQVTGAPSAKEGFFFTDKKEIAEGYASELGSAKLVALQENMDRLERIARRSGLSSDWDKHQVALEEFEKVALSEEEKGFVGDVKEVVLDIKNPLVKDFGGKAFQEGEAVRLMKQAKEGGHDGVIFQNVADSVNTPIRDKGVRPRQEISNVYAVFDKQQIKAPPTVEEEERKAQTPLRHRGNDPEAIKVAEKYGLSFDGMQVDGLGNEFYQFTTGEAYSLQFRGITFTVDSLNKLGARLEEKLAEFGPSKDFLPANVVRTDKRWDSMVRHLGYEPVTFENTPPGNIPTDIQLIRESQERLAKVEVLPASKLNKPQKAHLDLARAIAANLTSPPVRRIEAALIPSASDRVKTAGLYSQSLEEVYLSPDQLNFGHTTVDTTTHELAHHLSKAEDGGPEHQNAMAKVAEAIVKQTARGNFDDIIKKPEFQW